MRLAILSDLHAMEDASAVVGSRRGGIADLLLMRAVHRLNRLVKPDAVVLLGDLINDGEAAGSQALLANLAAILAPLNGPILAIPGNHDGDPERFASVFGALPDWLDVGGVRLVPFVDPEEPGYTASRQPKDLERMRRAGRSAPGKVIALHHVPLFPPGRHPCPYNYLDAESVIAVMRDAGIDAAVGGHYHPGIEPIRDGPRFFAACPALCEVPFRYLVLDIGAEATDVRVEALGMDPALELVDTHIHTQFAYCSENMEIGRVLELAPLFGLADIRFTEHSGHLYASRKDYPACWEKGFASTRPRDCRMAEYLLALQKAKCPSDRLGIEIDCCHNGEPLLRDADRRQIPFRIGAMHSLPAATAGNRPAEQELRAQFLHILEHFLKCGIDVLAHPFRVFRRSGFTIPPGLFGPTVRLLRQHGVAAELNFHTNEPPPEFVAMCLEERVPLTFGSDAHNLYEIGAFALHLDLLSRCGVSGTPQPYLLELGEESAR